MSSIFSQCAIILIYSDTIFIIQFCEKITLFLHYSNSTPAYLSIQLVTMVFWIKVILKRRNKKMMITNQEHPINVYYKSFKFIIYQETRKRVMGCGWKSYYVPWVLISYYVVVMVPFWYTRKSRIIYAMRGKTWTLNWLSTRENWMYMAMVIKC